MEKDTMAGRHDHPYYPQDALIPGYSPNSTPLPVILASFGGIIGVVVLGCVRLAKWYSPALKRADQLTIGWFALCEYQLTPLLSASQETFY